MLINLTAIVSVVLDLGFNVLFVREGARHQAEIQRYLRNVMSLRLLMSVVAPRAAGGPRRDPLGLGDLLVPGFLLMVLTSYSSLLRNGLYAVQQLGYEAVAVVLESRVLLALVLYGGADAAGRRLLRLGLCGPVRVQLRLLRRRARGQADRSARAGGSSSRSCESGSGRACRSR